MLVQIPPVKVALGLSWLVILPFKFSPGLFYFQANPYDLRRILVYFEGTFRCEAHPYQMKNFTEKRVTERQSDSHQALEKAMQTILQEHKDEIKERSGLSFAKALGVKHGE